MPRYDFDPMPMVIRNSSELSISYQFLFLFRLDTLYFLEY